MINLIQQNAAVWLGLGGFVIGMAFGAIVFTTNFCAMGAVSDFMSFGDFRRFRAWLLAAAVALVGTQMLAAGDIVPLTKSIYLGQNLNWFGNIAGGLLFGFGMVFAGGCASRNLVRAGSGDLRSLLTLVVLGLFAYMTIGGLLAPVRTWLDSATNINLGGLSAALTTQGLGQVVGTVTRMGAHWGNIVATTVVAGAVTLYCFRNASFRQSPAHLAAGIGIGLCAVAGWAVTGLAVDDLADKPTTPVSLTFVRPTGDALEWLQRFTAGQMPGFGVASVFGTMLGAFIAAKSMGRFRLATFADVGDTWRSLMGAALMGVGGVMALGCTMGQAITGVSTLAIGSFLTFAALIAGGMAGIKRLEASLMDGD